MNYNNYDTAIVETYGVKIVGWPASVPFTNPSNIGTIGEIRKLRDALKSGECRWKKLSKGERGAFNADLNTRCAAGESVKKPRKKRSDAGVSRKRKNIGASEENGPAPKRARHAATKKRSVPKSSEFVRDTDEDLDASDPEDE